MKIIISPNSRALRNGLENPKNWPKENWVELIKQLKEKGAYIIQIGRSGEVKLDGVDEIQYDLSLKNLKILVDSCTTWIAVDNFFPHFCYLCQRPGITLFAQSDPIIFGHEQNINMLKDRKYLREKQFDIWEYARYVEDAYVPPSEVIDTLFRRFDK